MIIMITNLIEDSSKDTITIIATRNTIIALMRLFTKIKIMLLNIIKEKMNQRQVINQFLNNNRMIISILFLPQINKAKI